MERFPIHPWVTYKTPQEKDRIEFVCDALTEALYYMGEYCEERKLPMVITASVSTPEEDKAVSREYAEHRQARAADISIHGWNEQETTAFETYFNQKLVSIAAVGAKSGKSRLVVVHNNGNGRHIHVQVSAIYAIAEPFKRKAVGPDQTGKVLA